MPTAASSGSTSRPRATWARCSLMTAVALGVVAVMNDMGTALLLYGIFLAMIYVATGRHLYTVLGLGLFAAGSLAVYRVVPHVQRALHDLDRSVGRRPHHRLPDRAVDRVDRRRRHLRHRPRPQPPGDRPRQTSHPGRADRRHLRRLVERDRPGRRRRPAADLPAVRLPRLQDRDARRRQLLEAAGLRAHVHVRAAGLPDRRRDHPPDPADRHHAAVRQLRRARRSSRTSCCWRCS